MSYTTYVQLKQTLEGLADTMDRDWWYIGLAKKPVNLCCQNQWKYIMFFMLLLLKLLTYERITQRLFLFYLLE